MDSSVLKVECAEVDVWQVSGIDGVDSEGREFLVLVRVILAMGRPILWTGPCATGLQAVA